MRRHAANEHHDGQSRPGGGDNPLRPRHDHRLRHAGDDHAGAGYHDRQCRPAAYAGDHVGDAGPDFVGADQLHRCRGHHDAADRRAGRPPWPQAAVHYHGDRLHDYLHALWRGGLPHRDCRLSAVTRCVRRRTCAAVASHSARHLSDGEARIGHGHLGHGRDGRTDPRPHARRLSDGIL